MRELAHVVRDYPGESQVVARRRDLAGPKTLEFGAGLPRAPKPDFYAEVKALLGEAAVL